EIEVITTPQDFEKIKEALEKAGIEILSAKITMVPKSLVPIDNEGTAQSLLKLMESLEDLDDVQQVYANFDIPEHLMDSFNK
ncbi:MAG: YebC/PmpR family DNA-binding transcriptional regulator, partial [Caldimicrobium sp.]